MNTQRQRDEAGRLGDRFTDEELHALLVRVLMAIDPNRDRGEAERLAVAAVAERNRQAGLPRRV